MRKHNYLLPALFLALSLSSCDIITGPKKDYDALQNSSDRVVLMEEFTGHTCGNCPSAHRKSATLKALYPDNYIGIAIHAGGFARLSAPPFNDSTRYYVTPLGAALEDYYDADQAGFPKGMINRKVFNGKILQNHADWGTDIGAELLLPPAMSIATTSNFNSATRNTDISVHIEYFQAGTADDNLMVVITEDSVVGPQIDYSATPEETDDYVHMDMLRLQATTGTWGEQLKPTPINTGEQFTKTYQINIPANMNAAHCHVVAYVINNLSKEVYQANEAEVE